jgi:hypothetical protein
MHGRPPAAGRPAGNWRATVTRVAGGVWVRIDRMNADHEFGPLEMGEGLWTAAELTTTVVSTHSHAFGRALAVGDRVLVAFIEGEPNNPIVVCRLP